MLNHFEGHAARRCSRRAASARRTGGALGLAVAAAFVASAAFSPVAAAPLPAETADTSPGRDPATSAPLMTTVDRVTHAPDRFYGQNVAVVGEVGEILGPRSFMLEDNDLLFDEHVVVVSSRPLTGRDGRTVDPHALDGRYVMVVGSVHPLDARSLQDQPCTSLAVEQLDAYAGRPAILATSIVTHPALFGPRYPYPYGGRPDVAQAPDGEPAPDGILAATVEDLVTSPATYSGQWVAVSGEVAQVLGPRAFTVTDDDLLVDEGIAVVAARPLVDRDGQPYPVDELGDARVVVLGIVFDVDRDRLQDHLGIPLDEAFFAGWEGGPVVLADSIRVLPGS